MKSYYISSVAILLISITFHVFAESSRIKMPEGFTDIYPLMELEEFLSVRKEVKKFGFFQDPKKIDPTEQDQTLSEDIRKHPFFEHGLYFFREGRLEGIVLAGKIKGWTAKSGRREFLIKIIRMWGSPDEIKVVELRSGKRKDKSAALFWKSETAMVAAGFSLERDQESSSNGILELKIMSGQMAQLDKLFSEPAISKQEKETFLAPVQSAIKQLLSGESSAAP